MAYYEYKGRLSPACRSTNGYAFNRQVSEAAVCILLLFSG